MKENKFRGISQYTGEMVYGQLLRGENDFNIVTNFSTRAIDIELVPIKKGTQGQFTGLYDKNNVAVYDGDITESLTFDRVEKSFVGEVFYDEKRYDYCVRVVGESEIDKYPLFAILSCEVIGNIYENTEQTA